MFTQLVRYKPIINEVLIKDYKKICEFGSGSTGIGKFININFTGIDVSFKDYGEVDIINKNTKMNRILIKPNHKIPFKDNFFDFSFSVDAFEHINKKKRVFYLKEMIRISRKNVIVGFPAGKKSLLMDKKLFRIFSFFKIRIPLWLTEHLNSDYPNIKEFDSFLKKNGYNYEKFFNESFIYHIFYSILERIPIMNLIIQKISTVIVNFNIFKKLNNGYRVFYLIEKE